MAEEQQYTDAQLSDGTTLRFKGQLNPQQVKMKVSTYRNSQPTQFEQENAPQSSLAGQGIDPGAQNPISRTLSAAGGALLGAPAALGSAILHPIDTIKGIGDSVNNAIDFYSNPATRPDWEGIKSVLPEAIGGGIGNVAAGELAGSAAKGVGKVAGPLKDAAGYLGRNEFNELRPPVKLASRAAGAYLGHQLGMPGVGELGGAYFGPEAADALIPNRSNAFSKLERKAVPLSKSPNANINSGILADQALAEQQAAAPPQAPKVSPWQGPLEDTSPAQGPVVKPFQGPLQQPTNALDEVYGPQQNISTDPYAPPSGPQDLISRTRRLVLPGEEPSPADLKRAGDLTQAPLPRLQQLAKFGDKLAQNEINRRLRNQ